LPKAQPEKAPNSVGSGGAVRIDGGRVGTGFPGSALEEHVDGAAGIRAFKDRCARVAHSGGVRARWTKALLYAAALGSALSGCAISVNAAHQVALVVVPPICTSANSSMNIVAHEDDDILFIDSPTYTDVAAGRCLTTVYLTAGDDGQDASYWQGREDGAMAAYAKMARVSNSWRTTGLPTVSGQAAVTRTLDGTDIRLIFLRLPTGSPTGRAIHHHECLSKLHAGTSTVIHAVDGTANYTSDSLRATLAGFMTTFHPGVVRTLDYTGTYGDGDHADHHNAAYYAYEAQRDYATPHRVQGFRGYPMTQLPANQSGADAARKLAIFLAYSAHDSHACQTAAACRQDRRYWPWMLRTYQVSGPPAPAVETAQDAPTDQIPAAEASLHRSQA
jgi:LmbE family N-acetylglucosaminyl deacetylase